MHGFGPTILHTLPREGRGLTTREIRAAIEARGARCPSLKTVQAHLAELRRLDLVCAEGRRYWRLVDSVLDTPREADLGVEG